MTMTFTKAEIGAMLSSVLLAAVMVFSARLHDIVVPLGSVLVFAMVVWIVLKDVSDFIIPDGPLIGMAVIGVASRLMETGSDLQAELVSVALDATVCGGALLAIREGFFRFRGVDGVGLGDVKLAAAGAILVGMVGFAWALFLSSVAGLVVVLAASLLNPGKKIDRLPFGAFLAPVCWGLWMFGVAGLA